VSDFLRSGCSPAAAVWIREVCHRVADYDSVTACRAVVGEVDDEIDSQIDFNELRAVPLKPVAH